MPRPPISDRADRLRVLAATDSMVVAAGMNALLRAHDLAVPAVVTNFRSLREGIRSARVHTALIAPVDESSPELTAALRTFTSPPVVLLLPKSAIKINAETISRGGHVALLPLTASPAEIVDALRAAASSNTPEVTLERLTNGVGGRLTPREQEVLDALVQGQSNEAIASTLSVAEGTVKAHLTNIYRKLGVTSRSEAIVAYLESG